MSGAPRSLNERVPAALADAKLRESLDGVRSEMPGIRRRAIDDYPDFEATCDEAQQIRDATLTRLDELLGQFEIQVEGLGGHVHRAADASEACHRVATICRDAGARRITKSKSMVTEEIELNAHLESAGFSVVETDLGEYIIQLRGEKPSHILAPALHVSLDDVAQTFTEHHAIKRDRPLQEADDMLAEARRMLRDHFLEADVGITGANFLVAETGGVVIVTNEGNADLTASLPDTHIVVTSVEKLVPTLRDTSVLLRVLARSAIGERLSCYTSFVHGPRRPDDLSGPRHFHVVVVDNGRRALLGTEFQPMLRCIRCSACLNHCPVYTAIGGHAYGSVYSGPMGAVLTPAIAGLAQARDLPNASTLCGRCESVCPVRIPLPKMLRRWREVEAKKALAPRSQRWGLGLWRRACRHPLMYRVAMRVARRGLRVLARGASPGWAHGLRWVGADATAQRDAPIPRGPSFQAQWRSGRRVP